MGSMGAIVFLPREGDTSSLMLENLLFDPAAAWLSAALERAGVERFLVVCHDDDRERAGECFPGGTEFVTDGAEDAAGQLTADSVPAKLEDMHRFALCLFRGAITDELHQAMGPTLLSE